MYCHKNVNDIALFGFISDKGQVFNLSVTGYTIGCRSSALLAGCSFGILTNCEAYGFVRFSGDTNQENENFGGIAGDCYGTILNCINYADVSGTHNTGGIAGRIRDNTILLNCANLGTIHGTDNVGGIAGESYQSNTLRNVYTIGIVTGNAHVGSIIGKILNQGTFSDFYSLESLANDGIGTDESESKIEVRKFTKNGVMSGSNNAEDTLIKNLNAFVAASQDNRLLTWYYMDGNLGGFQVHVHEYSDWASDGGTTHSKHCPCGDKVTEEHVWDEGVVTLQPTTTSPGKKTFTCKVCSAKRIESLPKLPPIEPPATGDMSQEMFGICMTALAFIAITAAIVAAKRRRAKPDNR